MDIFGTKADKLERRTAVLELQVEQYRDELRRLKAEWEAAQLDLTELHRRALNVIRSLAKREARQDTNGSGGGVGPGGGLDKVSQAILARRSRNALRTGVQSEPLSE